MQKQFHRIVEVRRIASIGCDDREKLLEIVAKQRELQYRLAGVHPVHVAAQRVDLAIVRDVAIRMRQLPTGKCIRRKALVDKAERADTSGSESSR